MCFHVSRVFGCSFPRGLFDGLGLFLRSLSNACAGKKKRKKKKFDLFDRSPIESSNPGAHRGGRRAGARARGHPGARAPAGAHKLAGLHEGPLVGEQRRRPGERARLRCDEFCSSADELSEARLRLYG